MGGTTRDKILDASLQVFERSGLAGATMGQIAAKAKVGRATLYRHFDSKEDVLQALVLREARELFGRMEEAAGAEDTPEALLEGVLPVAFGFFQGHRLFQRVLRKEPEFVLPYLTIRSEGLLTAAIDFMEPFLERAKKKAGLQVEPRVAAEWACRIILSMLTTPSVVADLKDPEELRGYLAPVLGAFGKGGRR